MDVISDVHLHAGDTATARALIDYLQRSDADALLVLGDLFEVWVGDDAPTHGIVAEALAALRSAAQRAPLYVMHGNRDFLLGTQFHQTLGSQPLPDPSVLVWGSGRWLLTHGDAWCLDDHDYQHFRLQVRSTDWQHAFLDQPLAARMDVARQMRARSQARKEQSRLADYADVDTTTALHWMQACDAQVLIHGHTHRPAEHPLPDGRTRLVLTDWDASAQPPRGGALRLYPDGRWSRLAWPPCA